MKNAIRIPFLALLSAVPVVHAEIISQSNAGFDSGLNNYGQYFEVEPAFFEKRVTLNSITFGYALSALSGTFLDIYTIGSADISLLNFSSGTEVSKLTYLGSSNNSITYTGARGDDLTWSFSGITLPLDTPIFAVLSSNNSAGSFIPSRLRGSTPENFSNITAAKSGPLFGGTVAASQDNRYAIDVTYPPEVVVTNTADTGAGSLREAIDSAPGGAVILFDPSLDGQTITLTSGQIIIDENLTIDASGLAGGLTLVGGGIDRILQVNAGRKVVLEGLSLINGRCNSSGGAILNLSNAILTVNRCTFSGNSASFDGGGGAILNDPGARLTLNQCTFAHNSTTPGTGGAIHNRSGGFLALNQSTVVSNSSSAEEGGGVANYGAMTIKNSIIADNSAPTGPDVRNSGGSITTNGINLLLNLSSSGLSAGPSVLVGSPALAPLGDYGGPTKTRPPLSGSPAIDAAGTTDPGGTDQRGFPRFVNGALDIGAVESEGPLLMVTNNNNSGAGSLRQNIADAPAGTTVFFASSLGGQTITLAGSALVISKSLTIDASSLADGITIDADGKSHGIIVSNNVSVVLDSLTVTGASGSFNGGGIINSADSLAINNCTITGNLSDLSGGGIYNSSGILTLSNTTISGNRAYSDGGAIYNAGGQLIVNNCTISGNIADQVTGGISNNLGIMTMNNSIVAANNSQVPHLANIYNDGTFTGSNNFISSADPQLAPLGDYGGPTRTMPPLPGSPVIGAGVMLAATPTTDQRGLPRPDGALPDIGAVEAQIARLVTNSNDSGPGSLREAIALAVQSGDIVFDPNFFNGEPGDTITLATGQLTLDKSISINASMIAGGVTIDAAGTSRIFEIPPGQTVSLDSLSLTGGNASGGSGGAIHVVESNLNLSACTILGNSAENNGGGIYMDGGSSQPVLTLRDCTLSGNSAFRGGGIRIKGGSGVEATLDSCTLSGNSAGSTGGGIDSDGANGSASLVVRNCTLFGNSAALGGGVATGGAPNGSGSIILWSCTFSDNSASFGGGIYSIAGSGDSEVQLINSILARNTAAGGGPDLYKHSGTVYAPGSNLISDNGSVEAELPFGLPLVGQAGNPADPRLAPLGDYGGPNQTMPPLPGSPVIDAAGTSFLTTDQRGFARPNGPAPDLGAVEAYAFTSQGFVDTDSDGIDDRLENGIFGNLTTADATSDFDGDGSSDKDEIANMTNVRDPNDSFRILAFTKAAGFTPANPVFDVTMSTFPGLNYGVETDDGLDNFLPLPNSDVTADGYEKSMQVEFPANAPRFFLRAVRKP